MGQKSKKKAGASSSSKSKKLEEIIPIVALPAANIDVSTSPAAANTNGAAMVGDFEALVAETGMDDLKKKGTDLKLPGNSKELESNKAVLEPNADASATVLAPASILTAPATVKPISTNNGAPISARRLGTQKNSEVFESTGAAWKTDYESAVRYFRLETLIMGSDVID